MNTQVSWGALRASKLQERLTQFAFNIDEITRQDARFENAMSALDIALSQTINYVRSRKNGEKCDPSIEEYLSSLWGQASVQISGIDIELADACVMKGLGWADPEHWIEAENNGVNISIEGMIEARKLLNSKRHSHSYERRPLAGPVHISAGRSILLTSLVLSSIFGVMCIYGGIQLIGASGSGETAFHFVGLDFTTKQAGVAGIGLGAIVVILVFYRVLKSLDYLGNL